MSLYNVWHCCSQRQTCSKVFLRRKKKWQKWILYFLADHLLSMGIVGCRHRRSLVCRQCLINPLVQLDRSKLSSHKTLTSLLRWSYVLQIGVAPWVQVRIDLILEQKGEISPWAVSNRWRTWCALKPYLVSINSFNELTVCQAWSVKGATHFSGWFSSSLEELSHKVVRSMSNDDDGCKGSVATFGCILSLSIHAQRTSREVIDQCSSTLII